jgi:chorismate mutase
MPDDIPTLRAKIDAIDEQMLLVLCERVRICKAIGSAKKKQGMPVRDASRENEVYKRVKQKAARLGLNVSQIEALYREIVNMCSSVQE